MRNRFFGLTLLCVSAGSLHAQDAGMEFFEKKIRPVLVEHCYECHAVGAKKVRGGLLLDSREALRKGGFTGPGLVVGDPDKSLLIRAVRYVDPEMKMPKKGKLSAAIIADFEAWVKMGAPDPREKAPAASVTKSWEEIAKERSKWWSLQPVKNPVAPMPKNVAWSSDPIDRFLLSAMEAKGMTPAKQADPHTLIRRLSLVLTGLPPTVKEVEAFVNAWGKGANPQAEVEQLVDRLLASPHFGERWARHWMDVVRFTETHGNEWNYDVHHAWRYRDYLIRAFNDDVPYDQFVREHIAGDLLPKARWNVKERFNESIIGTGFYRFGEVNHDDCIDLRSIGYDLADNQIDTLTKAFQGMTVACARCHDHKLDAISSRDYHAMLGILRSSRPVAHTIDAPEVNAEIMQKMRAKKKEIRQELAEVWEKEVEALRMPQTIDKLKDDKITFENPLAPWRQIAKKMQKEKATFGDAWKAARAEYQKEDAERTKFNEQFTMASDFRNSEWPRWKPDVRIGLPPLMPKTGNEPSFAVGGHGLRGNPSGSGDFTVAIAGDKAVSAILPGGAYTHAFSERLNGTMRSPVLSAKNKYISFEVLGDRASAVRLVSSGCQLNYRNYRYLTKNELHWITFPIPADADSLRTYAELMTKFDNPKFPDQLGQLGSGKDYRIPWEQAAADPRSYFGITQVVLHDLPAPPKRSLSHFEWLFMGPPIERKEDLARRYRDLLNVAIHNWNKDQATDEDVRWLDTFLQIGFLSNRSNLTPRLEKLIAEYRKLDAELALPRVVLGMSESGSRYAQPIFARGDCMKPGEWIPRGFVDVLIKAQGRKSLGIVGAGSGRLELANAIASRDNPLTARVMVNRLWHHLFGNGLVRSVDDFGHVGELASHPELLDYLAHRFIEEGWSMKRLIRAIVLTRAFQLAHSPSAAALEADPNNRLLSHYPARRMEAEAIRDGLLAASGRLDRTLYGLSISAYREKDYADRRLFRGPLDGNGRRSLYIKVTLMEAPKFLEVFNFPGGKVTQGRRDVTNVPAQALALLNDPFVLQQADVWSKRLIERKNDTPGERVGAMFRTAMGRDLRLDERERFTRFVTQMANLHNVAADGVHGSAVVWREVAHTMFNLQEFITIP